ncbi:uncharacterized protein LOC126906301 [Daktulosphaira vitifoliae]|uniref:uncharacterized protein LOC126906301 n=1 Tax=Daktulosphaira vitifoliae TaxID=58002 RepID=UPI0021AA21A0|nr:uncharacterized protein LOC126906301 [Daktulosphaira vitifoliae]XP_050542787.1 uncharacterized protein LOC126906301 [Daktulosphaira vitifoliae]
MDLPTFEILLNEDDKSLHADVLFSNYSDSFNVNSSQHRNKGTKNELLLSQKLSMVDDLQLSLHKHLKKDSYIQKSGHEIEPPIQFQDLPCRSINIYSPPSNFKDDQNKYVKSPVYTNECVIQVEKYADNFIKSLINDILNLAAPTDSRFSKQSRLHPNLGVYWKTNNALTNESSNSLLSTLSSSHNSLLNIMPSDDSNFISSAISHDVLNSDTYKLPIDSSTFNIAFRRPLRKKRKLRRHSISPNKKQSEHFMNVQEPIHMTLKDVRSILHNFYRDSKECNQPTQIPSFIKHDDIQNDHNKKNCVENISSLKCKIRKQTFLVNMKYKKSKESSSEKISSTNHATRKIFCSSPFVSSSKSNFTFSLKQTFCNIFRSRKNNSVESDHGSTLTDTVVLLDVTKGSKVEKRALPPVPKDGVGDSFVRESNMDFASSIEKAKDYGWYWGPISGEAAEKILSTEPDGSFIVRDSSDDHYIFSLTFKLNGFVRHVRIEHDHGNFSFGSCTKFKSHTIIEFVENAIEHSRSGRYLFFLHRRPVLGPMRVQLLHPVSRFKQIQSLQHMCRFVLLKTVRRDLIYKLPLPRRLIDYLNTPHYYCEQLSCSENSSLINPSPAVHLISFTPP